MGEKKAARLTPEQNEARQAARAAKREKARDARAVAIIASVLAIEQALRKTHSEPEELLLAAGWFLNKAKEAGNAVGTDDTGKA